MPTIGAPLQGYYYDLGSDTLRPLAGQGLQGVPGISMLGLTVVGDATANVTLTSMAAAEDYFNTSARYSNKMDLALYTQCRIVARRMTVAGAASSVLALKYSTTNPAASFSGAAWTASGAQVSLVPTAQTIDSGWVDMPVGMRANDLYIALTQSGGDGSASPILGGVWVYFRNPGGLPAVDTRGIVGYVEQTTQQAGIGATVVDLTGLTLTFPAIAGRRYKISWKTNMAQATALGIAQVLLTDGSNVQITTSAVSIPAGSFAEVSGFIVKTFATGTQTVKLRTNTNAGSMTTNNSSAFPLSFLVEDIG